MTRKEILQHVGQRVILRLSPRASGGPVVTGRIVGTLDAADGMVVTFEPEGARPGTQVTYHSHYIEAISPAPSGS